MARVRPAKNRPAGVPAAARAADSPAPPAPASGEPGRRAVLLVCAGLVVLCAAIYGQTLWHDFVNYDDPLYVTDNAEVRAGLSLDGLVWAFVTDRAYYFHPLTWLSHMLDCTLYGLRPWGHHLTNLVFHAAASAALFLAMRLLTGAFWPSAAVAALFAAHPLHVESVAWVAERKDVLSALFWMLALAAHARYARRGGAAWYAAVAGAFILGLMSKPMVVTLPCVLLLLDYWPLGRMGNAESPGALIRAAAPRVAEKIPLFAITLASSASTMLMQQAGNNLSFGENVPVLARVANAAVVYVIYLAKTVWPTGLAVFYPHPVWRPAWQVAGAALVLAVITLFCLARIRRQPYLITGWLWYIGTLVPVIELVQAGKFSHADRYTYIPSIGLYIMAAWGAADLAGAWRMPKRALAAAAAAATAAYALCAAVQTSHWRDSGTLFRHAIAAGWESGLAHNNLGFHLFEQGANDGEVEARLRRALELDPAETNALNNLGMLQIRKGNRAEALALLTRALSLKSDHVNALTNLGNLLTLEGRHGEARECLDKALGKNPNNVNALVNLGVLHMTLGENGEARRRLERALELSPGNVNALINLGKIATGEKRFGDANALLDRALKLKADDINALVNLGVLRMAENRRDEAAAFFEKARGLDPKSHAAAHNLGVIAMDRGRNGEAGEFFEKALELEPGDANTLHNLGKIRAGQGRLGEAEDLLSRALAKKPDDPNILGALGVLLVGQGRNGEARPHLEKALAAAPDNTVLLGNLGALCVNEGKAGEAEGFLNRALAANPGDVPSLINMGKLMLDQGRLEEAKARLAGALEKEPGNLAALVNLGGCLMRLGDFEGAAAPLGKALEVDPNCVPAMKNLAGTLAKLGRQGEADALLARAAALENAAR